MKQLPAHASGPARVRDLLRACEREGQALFLGEVTDGDGRRVHVGICRGSGLYAAGRFVAVATAGSRAQRDSEGLEELRRLGAVVVVLLRYRSGAVAVRGELGELAVRSDETILDAHHRLTVPDGEIRARSVGGIRYGYRDGELQIGSEADGAAAGLRIAIPKEAEVRSFVDRGITSLVKVLK